MKHTHKTWTKKMKSKHEAMKLEDVKTVKSLQLFTFLAYDLMTLASLPVTDSYHKDHLPLCSLCIHLLAFRHQLRMAHLELCLALCTAVMIHYHPMTLFVKLVCVYLPSDLEWQVNTWWYIVLPWMALLSDYWRLVMMIDRVRGVGVAGGFTW